MDTEKRRMHRPTARLEAELSDVERNIERIKDELADLKVEREQKTQEDKQLGLSVRLEIDAAERKHAASGKLKAHLNTLKDHLTLDLNHLRAAVEENGAEHVNISAFHQNMLNDSNELKITQADDKVKIESLEAQEKAVIEENDATQKELRSQLDKVEADLAAFQEITQLRQAYESGVTALASGGLEKVTALVEAELARTTAQDEAEALAAGEAEKKNNELVAEMQDTEASFVEKLKNIRSAMNAQVQTSARTDEYSQKVKTELELSEEQLRVQTTKKLELQACLETLENELSNHTLKAKGCAEDIAEQIDDSQQVLSAKEEACVAAKQQLIELGGTPEQKQKFARLCAYVREMTQEKQIVDTIVIEHSNAKAAMEAQQSQIEADLKGNAENLEKQSRDVQYKIEVDSRAMQLRADYAQDLGSDVTAAKAIGAELDATLMVANIPAVPSPRSSS